MGILDGFLKQAMGGRTDSGGLGGLMSMIASNPQILTALAALLSTRDTSVGGNGGLGGLMNAFRNKGMGDMISSWISTGPNPPITPAQVTDALGHETVGQFASKAGVPVSEASQLLAGLLPAAVDHLTPDGKVPDLGSLETSLTSYLSGLER